MRISLGIVALTIIAISVPVTADWCRTKCDAIFYGNETVLKSTILAIIPGSRNWLDRIGMQPGNAHHGKCVASCGETGPSEVCKNHCDFRFGLGRAAFKVTPSGVVQAIEAIGYGVSEKHYQECVSECLST